MTEFLLFLILGLVCLVVFILTISGIILHIWVTEDKIKTIFPTYWACFNYLVFHNKKHYNEKNNK
jgi:hypothetical protein